MGFPPKLNLTHSLSLQVLKKSSYLTVHFTTKFPVSFHHGTSELDQDNPKVKNQVHFTSVYAQETLWQVPMHNFVLENNVKTFN